MGRTMIQGLTGPRASMPRPARRGLLAFLLGLAGTAWLLSARLATPDMHLGVLTGAAMMSVHSRMGMPGAMPMSLRAFVATWTVMMVAMMVPSVISAAGTFDNAARMRGPSNGATALFLAGYLLLWGAIGAVAFVLVHGLQDWLPSGSMTALRIGAVLLLVAGVYQLTPPKKACLRRCRSPWMGTVVPVVTRMQGYLGAGRAGLAQGVYCLGSSWPLMLVLLLVGMMNLAWMGVITGLIFVEKVVPGGDVVSRVMGWALAAGGLILLAVPHTLPALGGA